MTKAKAATAKEIELNRWCIEQAMRWPTIRVESSGYGYGAHQAGIQSTYVQALPARDVDADIIGRAKKIADWVRSNR